MDEFVCSECFGDQGLKDFCLQHAESNECSFCGATSDEPIAAPIDDVVEHIKSCIYEHFDDPANAGLPYESAEGGYQGTTWETYEVFDELGLDFPKDDDGRLRDAVERGLDNDLWSEADPFRLTLRQQLDYSWEQFCRVIKHERRYFFFQQPRRSDDDDELLSPAETLRAIFNYAEQAGCFVSLAAGATFYRARWQADGEVYKTAGTLGPPPTHLSTQTNRMSPSGVVMTYASEDPQTALAETASGPGTFAIGEFVSDRELLILDLAGLPDAPSPFAELPDTLEYDPRPRLAFLHNVRHDISRPIARDDRVHIEYVPTQVVTEFLRTAVRIGGRAVDGIRYPSSRRPAGTAVVLFADQSNLILEQDERPEFYFTDERWLRLRIASTATVTKEDIAGWSRSRRAAGLSTLPLFEHAAVGSR